jgi:hypothetical protein
VIAILITEPKTQRNIQTPLGETDHAPLFGQHSIERDRQRLCSAARAPAATTLSRPARCSLWSSVNTAFAAATASLIFKNTAPTVKPMEAVASAPFSDNGKRY